MKKEESKKDTSKKASKVKDEKEVKTNSTSKKPIINDFNPIEELNKILPQKNEMTTEKQENIVRDVLKGLNLDITEENLNKSAKILGPSVLTNRELMEELAPLFVFRPLTTNERRKF